ncbi:SCO2400 family protein [Streptomyces vinaceus]|uniref:SCO2400 family protein n=1 Tax=Streptomyces vinaceus TaxID=1960 RepID=UPI0036C0CC1B
MDYCHACRRHLNGALACAGCGTPIEYLPPAAPGASAAPYGSARAEADDPLADPFADSLVVLSGADRGGRAGSRRRATHRRRRRTLLTLGVGLALAAGGTVALARIVTEGQKTDRAAEVVLTDGNGPQDPGPLPSGKGTPAAPTALKPVKASGSAKATAGATQSAGSGASAEGPAQPGPTVSASASGRTGPTQGATGPGPSVKPSRSGKPSPSASGSAQPPSPSPSPSPTKTGCWFIFFC